MRSGPPEPKRAGAVILEGVGLHSGRASRVTLRPRAGAVSLAAERSETPLTDLLVAATTRATTVQLGVGGPTIQTVEHLLAALVGLSIGEGLGVEVDAGEIPIMDGCACIWVDALRTCGVSTTPLPRKTVTRTASIPVGASCVDFIPPPPGQRDITDIGVRLVFDDVRIAPDARWTGSAVDFASRIAPARMFAFEHEMHFFEQHGLARHVPPDAVVVFTKDSVLHAGRPFEADEPARHKLLDLLGDLALYGGVPRGTLRVTRPGHFVTHEAMRIALESGVVV